MKTFNHSILLMLITLAVVGTFTACQKDDLPNGGEPRITYVRVTNPASSDSLLVGAAQGKLIAIMGENLGKAVEMWFNDQKANLNPTYITNTTILVNVPAQIPLTINNQLKINFSDGRTLLHQFEVQISKPLVSGMVSEHVNSGEIATIKGNFFYAPLTAKFTGGSMGEIVSVKDNEIQVRVPAGAQPGPITVKTNFGETESDFWFRDTRNTFIDSDPDQGWWTSSYGVTSPRPGDRPKRSGNYARLKQAIGCWSWNAIAGGRGSAMPVRSTSIRGGGVRRSDD